MYRSIGGNASCLRIWPLFISVSSFNYYFTDIFKVWGRKLYLDIVLNNATELARNFMKPEKIVFLNIPALTTLMIHFDFH